MGIDSSVFHKIFTGCSPAEISCGAWKYHKIQGHSILEGIEKEFSGNIKNVFKK